METSLEQVDLQIIPFPLGGDDEPFDRTEARAQPAFDMNPGMALFLAWTHLILLCQVRGRHMRYSFLTTTDL